MMSADTRHTPGPWEIAPYSDGDEVVEVVKDYEQVPGGARAHWIAQLDAALDFDSDQEAQLEEMYANARLIAAAPDLYAALKALCADMDRAGGDAQAIPECPWCHAKESRDGDEQWHGADCELVAARAALATAEGGPR